MTFKEKLQKEQPDKVSSNWVGGCFACPGDYWEAYKEIISDQCNKKQDDENCSACWNSVIPGTEVAPIKLTKPTDDDDKTVLVLLTKRQCRNLAEYIETEIFNTIRNDVEIDGFEWLCDVITTHVELTKALKE